ncbi:hypothetical protein BUALT_Bualt01G0001300 [Buddleja alternifolia]|uniref:RING-type domain-containing protein n=1 Tax=Buddleja alternifolia TaxID=168488 RepID=A0AAV6Y5D8_9LAMI|nr:hypothetical protein BUALT_Bualt01G0001300 [Buddleja alternifolia]
MDGPPANDVCSICHASFHLPCQANCSHWFCGSCILQVWDHGAALRPCSCPLCRREITLLVPSEASSRRRHMADVADILQRIQTYNRLYGERSNGLFQRMQDLPFLLKRLLRDILDPQRSLPLVIRARVYLAVKLSSFVFNYDSFRRQFVLDSYASQLTSSLKVPFCLICSCVTACCLCLFSLTVATFAFTGVLGIIGLLDDLIIVFICCLYVAALYRASLLSRHGGS